MIDREALKIDENALNEAVIAGNDRAWSGRLTVAAIRAAITAYLTSAAEGAVPAGWQLVPKEPVPEMLGAWYRYKSGFHFPDDPPPEDTSCYGAYRAMLAAAPHPPRQDGVFPIARHAEELVGTPCERCQGNGEIVTDWDRYMHAHDGDVGDEAVAECPDCNGTGRISQDGVCEDCPPEGYPTDKTRCAPCPRRLASSPPETQS